MHHCKEPAWKEPLTFSQWGPSRPAPHPDHVCCPEPGWGCPAAAACLGGCAAHCGRLPVCHGLLHPPCTCNGTRQVRNPQQKGRKHASFPRSTEITFTSTLTPSLPWCHLKTTHKSAKSETLSLFCVFLFTLACERQTQGQGGHNSVLHSATISGIYFIYTNLLQVQSSW